MAGFIKQVNPNHKVIFLGRTYTKDVIALSEHVDEFINYDEVEKLNLNEQKLFFEPFAIDVFVHVFPTPAIARLAKALKIKIRVGTTNRLYHWHTCNQLIKLSRKNSDLHEAQLNLKLLSFLGKYVSISFADVSNLYGFTKIPELKFDLLSLIEKDKIKIILHPKSKGSAKEWGTINYLKLIDLLPSSRYQIFISGTKQDALLMKDFLKQNKKAIDITGQLNLAQFILFINRCDILVAASTGPLHIAAALNKKAIGLFSSKRPMHPGRWAPLGLNAKALVYDEHCEQCKAGVDCFCIEKIDPQRVINLL